VETTPFKTLLRRQLVNLRSEAAWARAGLIEGQQPPHGFDVQVASAFDSIARAGIETAADYPAYVQQVRALHGRPWEVADAERVLEHLDLAVRLLSSG
jgi:hypothetical protein